MHAKVTEMDVYETPTLFTLVGRQRDSPDRWILQVHRTAPDGPIAVEEAETCSQVEVDALLAAAAVDGTPPVRVLRAYVLLGTIRFLEGHYMVFVTGRQCVGIVSGHAIYRVEETAMLSVSSHGSASGPSSSPDTGAESSQQDPDPATPSPFGLEPMGTGKHEPSQTARDA
eukprot:922905-Prymnesium_polylepis.1